MRSSGSLSERPFHFVWASTVRGKNSQYWVLVEPGALDVEQTQPGEPGKCKRIDCELRDRAVGASVGFVVKDMHRAVAHCKKSMWPVMVWSAVPPSGKSRMPVQRFAVSA